MQVVIASGFGAREDIMMCESDVSEIEVPRWFETGALISHVNRQPDPREQLEACNRRYLVMISAGVEGGGKRATLVLSAACAAGSLDLETDVLLIGDGAHWANDDVCEKVLQPGFPPLFELYECFVERGGIVYICAARDPACGLKTPISASAVRARSSLGGWPVRCPIGGAAIPSFSKRVEAIVTHVMVHSTGRIDQASAIASIFHSSAVPARAVSLA